MGIFNRIANWVRGRRRPSPFTVLTGPEGRKMLVDPAMMEYLNLSAPQPTQATLDSLMDQVCAAVPELEGRYLRVITLADKETIHNAFLNRRFKP